MPTFRIVLHFPKNLVNKPILYHLVKDYDLTFNILKAEVDPKEEGLLVLELGGENKNYKEVINYLKREGVGVELFSQDVAMDKKKCVDCGVCVPLCPTEALVKDEITAEVNFLEEKCIACGICLKACPYGAMKIQF